MRPRVTEDLCHSPSSPLTRVDPVYPVNVKTVTGATVVLSVIIGKEGIPEQIRIASAPSDFQKSSLDAVRQWRWEPCLLNGDPIELETAVTVIFSKEK
jgi:hypothetical protein